MAGGIVPTQDGQGCQSLIDNEEQGRWQDLGGGGGISKEEKNLNTRGLKIEKCNLNRAEISARGIDQRAALRVLQGTSKP